MGSFGQWVFNRIWRALGARRRADEAQGPLVAWWGAVGPPVAQVRLWRQSPVHRPRAVRRLRTGPPLDDGMGERARAALRRVPVLSSPRTDFNRGVGDAG